jgi:hypothetical protein
LIVFLKTYEEAVCGVASGCRYEWLTAGLSTVTAFTTAFDDTLKDYVMTITGTSFVGTTTDTELYVDDLK